ncbi:MAG: hypothetical protein LBS20_11715 [Prevotella sp.]|jgi:hypothetical protein|nr:hypothetical protein [Prevotella sp.]
MEYHLRVFNHQFNQAKEDLRQHLKEKGNLTELDAGDDDSLKYTALYIDRDGESQAAYYRQVEVSDDNRLYIELSDGHCIHQEDITINHIMDIFYLIQDECGTYVKPTTKSE